MNWRNREKKRERDNLKASFRIQKYREGVRVKGGPFLFPVKRVQRRAREDLVCAAWQERRGCLLRDKIGDLQRGN